MKSRILIACLALAGVHAQAQEVSTGRPSPAEISISRAQEALRKAPSSVPAHNQLAMALARRARETSDPKYYDKAETVLQQALALDSSDLEAGKVKAWILLGKHEFAAARDEALKLSRRAPDDVIVQGLLSDAHVNLGNYEEAEAATQRMLDLQAGNVPGLTRGAYLRELYGDITGGIELMEMAYAATPMQEVEDRAWILTHLAHLRMLDHDLELAEASLAHALQLFPDYHYALSNLAKVRLAQKHYLEAVKLLQKRYQAASHPENLFDLAEALQRSGRSKEAVAAFEQFEQLALAESTKADNSNHELVFYYSDHAGKPGEALRIARMELARRQDIHTRDAYAWALHVNGQHAEASKQIESILAIGTKDPRILEHARKIRDE